MTKYAIPPYRIFPLGDAGVVLDFGNVIDDAINDTVIALFEYLGSIPHPGITEFVPAYSSLTIYYDLTVMPDKHGTKQTAFETITSWLEKNIQGPIQRNESSKEIKSIPVCYETEYGKDLSVVSALQHLSIPEIIEIHTSRIYKVYMLGFLPGFAYMGQVDERLKVPRKSLPENVLEGSIGIAGIQTGIYSFNSPGGWQVIGRTPVKMFDCSKDHPAFLYAGDMIRFYPISSDEFKNY